MTEQPITQASDPDLRASQAAMQRAAEMARRIAVQTDTAIVVVEDGKVVRIPAHQLRGEMGTETAAGKLSAP